MLHIATQTHTHTHKGATESVRKRRKNTHIKNPCSLLTPKKTAGNQNRQYPPLEEKKVSSALLFCGCLFFSNTLFFLYYLYPSILAFFRLIQAPKAAPAVRENADSINRSRAFRKPVKMILKFFPNEISIEPPRGVI